jgi:hypothetical protein
VRGILPLNHALMRAFAQLPQNHTHYQRSYEQNRKEDDLMAGNHG